MNPQIDAYLARAVHWRDEMTALRAIALDCGLDESLKWGKPCFGKDGRNIAIVQPFKETCAFMFFKGALLDDPDGLLEKQGAESHAARRAVFTDTAMVEALETRLRVWPGSRRGSWRARGCATEGSRMSAGQGPFFPNRKT